MKYCSVRQPADVWPRRPCIALLMLLLTPFAGVAQDYPEKTIRYIVPAAPGGASDILARLLTQKMSEAFGKQVIVDNRAGGGTIIGTALVAKARHSVADAELRMLRAEDKKAAVEKDLKAAQVSLEKATKSLDAPIKPDEKFTRFYGAMWTPNSSISPRSGLA